MRLRYLAAATILGLSLAMIAGPKPAAALNQNCRQKNITVKLSPLDLLNYTVVGWLCHTGSLNGKTVQVLNAGGGHDHNYWDLSYKPARYSYVRDAIHNGYAVFNFDRIGTGLSDTPPSQVVTVQSEAYVSHQII